MDETEKSELRFRPDATSNVSRRSVLSMAVKTGVLVAARPYALLAEGQRGADTGHEFIGNLSAVGELPREAKPWAYWFWFYGNVTEEGIKADLQAMKDIGIGGTILLNVAKGDKGPVRFLSPEWQKLMEVTLAEAARLGLEIDVNNCDGWSDAGGPWVPPEHSMQKLVWAETHVEGGKKFSGKVVAAPAVRGFYSDISVFAVPNKSAPVTLPQPSIKIQNGKPSMITHEYPRPVRVQGADVNVFVPRPSGAIPVVWELQASDDGQTFRTIYQFDNRWRVTRQHVPRVITSVVNFAPVEARYFRLVAPFMRPQVEEEEDADASANGVRRVLFTLMPEARVALWQHKGGHINQMATSLEPASEYPNGWVEIFDEKPQGNGDKDVLESIIASKEIVDLTAQVHDGHLDWDVPQGNWTIVRLGHTTTGSKNHTGSEGGIGLNVDMMSKSAFDAHFPHVLGKVSSNSSQYVGKSLTAFHSDSWEAGIQNWTADFLAEFETRRGYSLRPYLAILAGGRIVDSLEVSERVLWDFRRTIADMIAENFWGHQQTLAKQHGVLFSGEGAGRQQFLKDPLLYLSKADMPMGEFWLGEGEPRPDCPASRSVSNAYGKRVTLAESYTSAIYSGDAGAGQWQDHPYSLKAYGDRAFCRGINKFVFHRSLSQPSVKDLPGLAWGTDSRNGIGINMERTNTWWNPGAAWISYLARCQHLLQSGKQVVDVCALVSENVPNYMMRPDGLADGYAYDGIHPEILRSLTVERREIVTPHGMRYRVLMLPNTEKMTLATMREVARLIDAGAVVAGPSPKKSPSLRDRDAGDEQLRTMAAKYWGSGKVSDSVSKALASISMEPDFLHKGGNAKAEILFVHRRTADADVYFISNQTSESLQIDASFRVTDRVPEFLDADSGEIRGGVLFQQSGQRTVVPVLLDPSGSTFVLFRKKAIGSVVSVRQAGTSVSVASNAPIGSASDVEVIADGSDGLILTALDKGPWVLEDDRRRSATVDVAPGVRRPLTGEWSLRFDGLGNPAPIKVAQLKSWAEFADSKVKYFSGSATYELNFEVATTELAQGRVALLDLGDVSVIAKISVNGKVIATKWKPPFAVDISAALRPGANTLAVTVTNLWPNRLIGDEHLTPDQKYTKTNYRPYKADSPLLKSGLLGPVSISFASRQKVAWKQFK